MFEHNLIIAWRNLWKYKLQTLISILGLAVGLTCFVICNESLRLQLVFNRNLPYVEDTYVVGTSNSMTKFYPLVHAGIARRMAEEFPEIEKSLIFYNLGGYTDKMCVVEHEDGRKTWQHEYFTYTDTAFMDFYGFKLLQGDWEKVKNQPDAVILTLSAARRIFGTTDVIGKVFTEVNDFEDYTRQYRVAAIMPDFPQWTSLEMDGGIILNPADSKTQTGMFSTEAAALYRLRPGIDFREVNRKITAFLESHPELKKQRGVPQFLCPYLRQEEYSGRDSGWSQILMMSGIGLLVLLTAVFNYVLFMTGRIFNRRKEYGIRKISGASGKSIFRMFTTEISLSMGIAVLVGLLLLEILLHLLTKDVSIYFSFDENRNWLLLLGKYMLLYALPVWGVMVGTCCVILYKVRAVPTLRNLQGDGLYHKTGVRNILLGVQLAICILFGGGAFFLWCQQQYVQKRLCGNISLEECGRIYSFSLGGEKLTPIRNDFRNMINANPYIIESCRSGNSLLTPWSVSEERWSMEGLNNEMRKRLSFMYTDANYLDFIHARMEEGRFYRKDEPQCAVVNREFVRRWGIQPLGKELVFEYAEGPKSYRIVGIIEDIIPIEENPVVNPCVYLPYPDNYMNQTYYVKLRPGADPKVLDPLKNKMQEQVNVFTPLWIDTLREDIGHRLKNIQEIGILVFLLTVVCIVISLLGIYSSMMLAVEKRSREMAIRKINGASLMQIAWIFGRHYLWLLGGAALLAIPLLFILIHGWLENYNYHITVTIWPFIGIFLIMVLIIGLTIGSQLLKIVRVNPVERLKND